MIIKCLIIHLVVVMYCIELKLKKNGNDCLTGKQFPSIISVHGWNHTSYNDDSWAVHRRIAIRFYIKFLSQLSVSVKLV